MATAFADEVVHYGVDVEFLESAARVAIQPPLVSSKIRLSIAISLPPVSHTFENLLQGAECEHRQVHVLRSDWPTQSTVKRYKSGTAGMPAMWASIHCVCACGGSGPRRCPGRRRRRRRPTFAPSLPSNISSPTDLSMIFPSVRAHPPFEPRRNLPDGRQRLNAWLSMYPRRCRMALVGGRFASPCRHGRFVKANGAFDRGISMTNRIMTPKALLRGQDLMEFVRNSDDGDQIPRRASSAKVTGSIEPTDRRTAATVSPP